jgi:hypothetical protein
MASFFQNQFQTFATPSIEGTFFDSELFLVDAEGEETQFAGQLQSQQDAGAPMDFGEAVVRLGSLVCASSDIPVWRRGIIVRRGDEWFEIEREDWRRDDQARFALIRISRPERLAAEGNRRRPGA